MNLMLAKIIPQKTLLQEGTPLAEGTVWAGLLVLLLICVGVALDFALVVYCLKRPIRWADWASWLKKRALPGRLILGLCLLFTGLYVTMSLAYGVLFSDLEIGPYTLLFQTLFFQLPALLILYGLLHQKKISKDHHLGLDRNKLPQKLGLSVLLYLAALPLLWFYTLLYQIFLDQLGHSFYLQDVTHIFLMPLPWALKTTVILAAIVAAPIFEEIVFRGILFPWLARRIGLGPGIALVSICFASMHLHLPSLLPLFIFSALLCLAYTRTRSLWVPIGMHALFNSLTLILLTLTGSE